METLPPGQAATSSMPKAMPLLIGKTVTSMTVKRGSITNWANNPVSTAFFWLSNCVKCSTLISSATPNMIMARQIFRAVRLPDEKCMETGSDKMGLVIGI